MRNFTRLTLATSSSPNDSQLLGAVMLGKIQLHAAELKLEVSNIEDLDRAALDGRYDISKVSCAIYDRIERDYELLETGAALADRKGPLVVTRAGLTRADLRNARVVAAAASTTAQQLFKRWAPQGAALIQRCSDEIVPALASGEFDAAVIDHQGQLNSDARGIEVLINLGEWWRADTGLPVPLGCYVIRRRLHERFSEHVEQLMRCALRVAEKGDADVADYVRAHAESMDDEVIREHLALYINNFTRSLGQRGRQAIKALRETTVAAA